MDGGQAEYYQEGESGEYPLGGQFSSRFHVRGEQHKHDGHNTDSVVCSIGGSNECSSEDYQ